MGKKDQDAALRQVFQLGDEIMSGRSSITAEDIDRFRRWPQGPIGHALLMRSERLPPPTPHPPDRLADLAMAPDGRACLLWEVALFKGYKGMRAQIGEQEWHLKLEGTAAGWNGRIIDFSRDGAPITELRWSSTERPEGVWTMIFIGETPIQHTRSLVSAKTHVGWTSGVPIQFYCMRRDRADPDWYKLVAYDGNTGEERFVSDKPGPHVREGVRRLVVVSETIYAFMTNDRTVTIHAPWLDKPGVVRLEKGEDIAANARSIWRTSPKNGFELLAHEDPWPYHEVLDERRRPAAGYICGMHFATGATAYVARRRHDLQGWNQGTEQHPGFERVTNLHCEHDQWSYWGLSGNHLFRMELPTVPNRR